MISFASLFSAPEATPSYGEPEWMPSPAEVARARADLERRGVVQSMTRDLAGTPKSAPLLRAISERAPPLPPPYA